MVSPLGDTNTGHAHLGGLTAFGAQVVKECNRLGIVVDMAHASHETVQGALKVATQPLIVSHTNLDSWTGKNLRMAEMMKPRLISKGARKGCGGRGRHRWRMDKADRLGFGVCREHQDDG